ncbi:hypothetical protein BGX38DRAFT_1146258 [Terfezia claveryi]|nr:hypothetical protein BGX38DRAFT_1146258 [Terfezia claveryi]
MTKPAQKAISNLHRAAYATLGSSGAGPYVNGRDRLYRHHHQVASKGRGRKNAGPREGVLNISYKWECGGKNNHPTSHEEEEEVGEEEDASDSMGVNFDDSDHDLHPVLLPHKLRVPLHTVDPKCTRIPPASEHLTVKSHYNKLLGTSLEFLITRGFSYRDNTQIGLL